MSGAHIPKMANSKKKKKNLQKMDRWLSGLPLIGQKGKP